MPIGRACQQPTFTVSDIRRSQRPTRNTSIKSRDAQDPVPILVTGHIERRPTRFEHQEEIRRAYGLREFAAAEAELAAWVDARAWTTGDGPKAIFTDAVAWLRERRVLLPGVTTPARLVTPFSFLTGSSPANPETCPAPNNP